MAQLLVRKLEENLIQKIKKRAAENGVSVEEEHRRILRAALADEGKETVSFLDHLLTIPEGTEDLFERDRSLKDRASEVDWGAEEAEVARVPLYTSIVAEPDSSEL